jgi:hypothetical protein
MDADLFDVLSRRIGRHGTRRGALAMVAGIFPAGRFTERLGEAKKGKKGRKNKKKKCRPRCSPCEKCVKRKCRPKPGAAGCKRDTCTRSGDGAVTVRAEQQVGRKTLRAVHSGPRLGDAAQIQGRADLTLDGAPLLAISTQTANGTTTVTITYGGAFSGIRRAQFSNDGTTVTGEVDGRAIVPLAAGTSPDQAKFADGNPPPRISIDPAVAKAIQQVFGKLSSAATTCGASSRTTSTSTRSRPSRGRGRRHRSQHHDRARDRRIVVEAHPETSVDCLALYIPCQLGFVTCTYAAPAACAVFLFGYGICLAAALLICGYTAMQCRKSARHGRTCCPVPCGGGDVLNPFSEDPACCEPGETCLDPNRAQFACCPPGTYSCHASQCCPDSKECFPGGKCCEPGSIDCGGECCGAGSCIDGECCVAPNAVCNGQCCPPFSSCCGGTCCAGSCVAGHCCEAPSRPCGSSCCNGTCCNGVCCDANEGCDPVRGVCTARCGQFQRACENIPGMPTCCLFDEGCCQNGSCCAPGTECCRSGGGFVCSASGCIQ